MYIKKSELDILDTLLRVSSFAGVSLFAHCNNLCGFLMVARPLNVFFHEKVVCI